MAILKGVNVTVRANGQDLPEYDYQEGDGSGDDSVTKYVEAISGSAFEFNFWCNDSFDPGSRTKAMHYRPVIDGKRYTATVPSKPPFISWSRGEKILTSAGWVLQQFQFSDIITDETVAVSSNEAQALKELTSQLGTITVEVRRVRKTERIPAVCQDPLNTSSSKPLPEKALKGKAISHKHSLGVAKPSAGHDTVKVEYIDEVTPFAMFHFKYRSRKALQALYIIPRDPSPVPLEERPVEELSRTEMMEILRRRRRDKSKSIKPEERVNLPVKRERDPEFDEIMASARPVRKAPRTKQAIEVVDLSGD